MRVQFILAWNGVSGSGFLNILHAIVIPSFSMTSDGAKQRRREEGFWAGRLNFIFNYRVRKCTVARCQDLEIKIVTRCMQCNIGIELLGCTCAN